MRTARKRLLTVLAALALGLSAMAGNADSLRFAALDSLLLRYCEAMLPLENADKVKECDFLIESCKDSATRQHVALTLFDHYRTSKLMGEEEVAIRIYDNWMATKRVAMRSEFDQLDADLFVRFNRSSLIGMDAPSLRLRKPCGGTAEIPAKGKTTLLFFYEPGCSKCRAEVKLLPQALSTVDFPLELAAIYTGTDRKAWRRFRREIQSGNPRVKVRHFWDPEIASDYQMKYAVIGTPRLFSVEPGGTIIGRRLELDSLPQLLPVAKALQELYIK